MMRQRTGLALALACAALVAMWAPAMAGAAGASTNAFGVTYVGQAECLVCHGTMGPKFQIGDYQNTAHGRFVTVIEGNTAALSPSPLATWWPSPTIGNGLRFAATEVKWMLGAENQIKQYVSIYPNVTQTIASGQSVTATSAAPADDLWGISGPKYYPATKEWKTGSSPTTVRSYFQSCGGCHHLGVTRPSTETTTLPNGGEISPSTVTTVSGIGIQCEHCHGSGEARTHFPTTSADVVSLKDSLKSQACGQCHATMTAKQKNYVGGSFSNPNGFTPSQKLSDFVAVEGTQYIKAGLNAPIPSIPSSASVKFWPNGSNKSMNHTYYNEWMISKHARSMRYQDGSLWFPKAWGAKDSCLRCHSGEAFLKSIGYGTWQGGQPYNSLAYATSNIDTDILNVECAICHTIHAPTGEALGLRLEANELCMKCHNGELEAGKAPLGHKLHHTIEEMFEGHGMYGVPDSAERFMKGVECIDCHMPRTAAKYPDRKTHSFNIMTPGDAAEWGVWSGGDSCTPCHESMTRAELQAELDDWAEDLEALDQQIATAVTAAKSRPVSTTAEDQKQKLILSAEANQMFVEADESNGAHNYPYAKAGLEKAVEFAKAVGASYSQFAVTSYSSASGFSAMYGTLKYGDGTPAAGKTVAVQRRAAGTAAWENYDTVTTSANGGFGLAVVPVTSHAGVGSTEFRLAWNPGIAEGTVYSAIKKVTIGSKTTIRRSRTSMKLGYTVGISGAVSPNHSGKAVTLQYKRGTGAWTKLTARTLGSTSAYSYTYKPKYRGTYYFRTVFPGDASHAGSVSPVVAVKVY